MGILRRRLLTDEPRGLLGGLVAKMSGVINRNEDQGPQCQRLIDDARARRDELEGQLAEAALDALTGDSVAQDRHQRLTEALDAVNAEIGHLEQALDVAAQRDAKRADDAERGNARRHG